MHPNPATYPSMSVAAEIWVWESLWSTRRHARADILDVALFDHGAATDLEAYGSPRNISRWLFTARDGRVMKKATSNTSLGALKQALLGRTLRGASEGESDAKAAGDGPGRTFATALLSSGKIVTLDEDVWTALVVGGGSGRDFLVAVMALVPGDTGELWRGHRQRVTCEYRAKFDGQSATGGLDGTFSTPIQSCMTTYVFVSSDILRQAEERDLQPPKNKKQVRETGGTRVDGRLISKVKATNQEVETKLRRIVQWVQEARRVNVLSMSAVFTVLPSPGAGAPGVWLERAFDVCMVPKNTTAGIAAPIADLTGMSGQKNWSAGPESAARRNPPAEISRQSDGTEVTLQQCGARSGSTQPDSAKATPTETINATPIASGTRCTLAPPAAFSHALPHSKESITAMLSSAADAALSMGEEVPPHATCINGGGAHPRGDRGQESSLVKAGSTWGRRGCAGPDDTSIAPVRERCAGDFCAYQRPSELPLIPNAVTDCEKTEGGENLDWTDVNFSNEAGPLLEVVKQKLSPLNSGKEGMLFSITFKSVGLARMEARARQDFYWAEPLRKCWKERACRAGGLEGLSPLAIYKEVTSA